MVSKPQSEAFWQFCEKVLNEAKRKIRNCLRGEPEFYEFSGASRTGGFETASKHFTFGGGPGQVNQFEVPRYASIIHPMFSIWNVGYPNRAR